MSPLSALGFERLWLFFSGLCLDACGGWTTGRIFQICNHRAVSIINIMVDRKNIRAVTGSLFDTLSEALTLSFVNEL